MKTTNVVFGIGYLNVRRTTSKTYQLSGPITKILFLRCPITITEMLNTCLWTYPYTCWSPSLKLFKHKFWQNIHPLKRTVRIITNPRLREKCRPPFKSPKLMTLPCIYILKTYIYFWSKCDLKRGSDVHSYSPINRVGDNFNNGRAVVHFITTLPIRQI